MSERGQDFDAKRDAYNAAHSWLLFLIDHPERSVSPDEFKGRIRDAKAECDEAHKAMLAAWA